MAEEGKVSITAPTKEGWLEKQSRHLKVRPIHPSSTMTDGFYLTIQLDLALLNPND